MTCKCGHVKSDHARHTEKPFEYNECFKCADCMKFVDNSKNKVRLSEACEWDSHEHCEWNQLTEIDLLKDYECKCICHSKIVEGLSEMFNELRELHVTVDADKLAEFREKHGFPVK